MDKALVTLALDSFQGVYGASQPNYHFATARSGYVSPLAGIARLLWGIGAWNQHLAAPVSLACCQGYEQPPVIAALASETHARRYVGDRTARHRRRECSVRGVRLSLSPRTLAQGDLQDAGLSAL